MNEVMRKKLQNKKGFTLAELLIVVAIIAVLTAIAIPVFAAQLEKSREATDMANLRAAYAEVVADYLSTGSGASATVTARQKDSTWHDGNGTLYSRLDGTETPIAVPQIVAASTWKISIDGTGSVSITTS